jgi:hypothetical protein
MDEDDYHERPIIECKEFANLDNFNIHLNSDSSDYSKLSDFRVLHLNIRSYNKNFDEFLILWQGIKKKYNCIILTEAWLSDDSGLVSLEGYNLFRSYNSLNQCDGIVVYIDDTLSVTCNQISIGNVATTLSLSFKWANIACELLCIYRSPSTPLLLFNNGLQELLDSGNLDHARLRLIAGDINCDILHPNINTQEERYLDILYENGYVACIDKTTRPTANTCIDHFFIKLPHKFNANSSILQTNITDHFIICLEINCASPKKDNLNKKYYHKINWFKVENTLQHETWQQVLDCSEVDGATEILNKTLQDILKQNTTKHLPNSKETKLKPWLTGSLLASIRHRDNLSREVRRNPFNVQISTKYRRYRNTLKSLIKRAKFDYYRCKIDEARGDPRKFWGIVNDVAGRSAGRTTFPLNAFGVHGDSAVPSSDYAKKIGNDFNMYFASVGSRLAEALNPAGTLEVDDADYVTNSVFFLRPVTEDELTDVIRSVRGNSAPGWDGIPTKLIKYNIGTLIKPLLYIVNLSILSGKFPTPFKIAKVIPLYKSGQNDQPANYRPISLLCTISKILEKCVKLQLANYLEREKIISDSQFGFKKESSTSHALFEITKFISKEIGNKKRVLVTFLDLAKAFDSIDRHQLIAKLQHLGIRSIEWFISYLENRSQFVSIDGNNSDKTETDYGVVQGSTLGPLLFLMYINNLTKVNARGKLFLFADDTAVVSSGCTWDEAYENAEADLIKIKRWLDQNTLTLNVSKTKHLPIFFKSGCDPGRRRLALHTCNGLRSAACDCSLIERVEKYKYLGVTIDRKLCWAPHIQGVKQKLRKFMYAFSQLGRVLTVGQSRTVYFAYVQSLLQYGLLAWGGVSASALRPIAVTQRTLIKIILHKPLRFPTEQLFSEFRVLDIRQIYIKTLLIFAKTYKTSIFTEIQHNYPTRHRLNFGFDTPRSTLSSVNNNPFLLVHVLYRNLPSSISEAGECSVAVYKKRVFDWLFSIGREASEALIHSPYT